MSDNDRREVARRLRAYLETPAPWHLPDVVSDVLGDKGDHDRIAHLADLIEPSPSCEFWDAEEKECYSVHTARPVDRDALLALAEDVTESAAMATAVDASKSAEMLAELLLDIARRIREACGKEGA